jgi:hypothetical protein
MTESTSSAGAVPRGEQSSALLDRLCAPGPKRILALDGGGIRGVVTLAFLARVQGILRDRYGDPAYLLSDYFDLIGGTSTGAIIAALLALGMDVDEVIERYMRLGGRVFGKKKLIPTSAAFDSKPLQEELQSAFGDRRLDDASIRTGLCIVTKRADTRSTWPLVNHPLGQFYARNRAIPLWAAVRASAAAPGYFSAQMIDVGDGEQGLFVDGGVSMAKNPALLLFLIATLQGFPFRWPIGEDRLFLLSVGTGTWRERTRPEALANYKIWNWAAEVPGMLMDDSASLAQVVLQCLSRSVTPVYIDSEMGDLAGDLWTGAPALSFLRYDVRLEDDALRALGLTPTAPAKSLRRLQAAEHRQELFSVGAAAAAKQVDATHFSPAFDVRRATA